MKKTAGTIALFQLILMTASADCTTNISVPCHTGDTNPNPSGSLLYPYIITTTAYDVQCITITNAGYWRCISVTNDCKFDEYVWSPILGASKPDSKTNKWVTTTVAGGDDCPPNED